MRKNKVGETAFTRHLFAKMHEKNHNFSDLAKELGITKSYVSQLSTGNCSVDNLSDVVLERCIAYIGLPKILGLLLAQRVRMADFFASDVCEYQSRLDALLETLATSSMGLSVGVLPEQLTSLPQAVKELLALLYEQSEQKEMLAKRVTREQLEAYGQPFFIPFQVRRQTS